MREIGESKRRVMKELNENGGELQRGNREKGEEKKRMHNVGGLRWELQLRVEKGRKWTFKCKCGIFFNY